MIKNLYARLVLWLIAPALQLRQAELDEAAQPARHRFRDSVGRGSGHHSHFIAVLRSLAEASAVRSHLGSSEPPHHRFR